MQFDRGRTAAHGDGAIHSTYCAVTVTAIFGAGSGRSTGPMARSGLPLCQCQWLSSAERVIMSWKGDSQATAPIGRKASTNVMPVLKSIQNQEIQALNHALKGVPPELSFEVRWQVSLVLKTCTKVVFLFSQWSFSLLS